jgi:formamidopyrimidine-DNA glycosylase
VPELPDVEGFRHTFARHAEGKRVHGVRAVDRGMLRNSSPAGLGRALSGRRFASPRRHGSFDGLLAKRRGSIKATLMDQSFAAGLGNLTADESLWQARIDPRRRVAALDEGERDALHRKIQKVLRDSLPYGLVPGKRTWLTGARDRRDPICPRCGTRLRRVKIGGRTTVFCPDEQS